ncbi:MAG: hypothetical protein K0S08_1681 [Gammaproteobacteria bacterium]|jgi:hypothetical protein|nr:hypothetical protein [Gammaproteobacteria bacterium]
MEKSNKSFSSINVFFNLYVTAWSNYLFRSFDSLAIKKLERSHKALLKKHFSRRCLEPTPKILIISPDIHEQNFLTLIFLKQKFYVEHVRSKEELLHTLSKTESYSIVIASESFKEVGMGFLVSYFKRYAASPYLIYLSIKPSQDYLGYGFDACIDYISTPQDILDTLPPIGLVH